MIKEWYYETFINGKKYRVNCVESDGYGGSRMRSQSLTLINEESNEEILESLEETNKGEEVEERTKAAASE